MIARSLSLVLFTLTLVSGAPEDAVHEIRLSLREDKLPGIVTYVINNSYVDYKISVQDMIQLSKLDRYSLEQINELFDRAEIELETAYSVDSLEKTLNISRLEFRDFFASLRERLKLESKQISQALLDLDIDAAGFLLADMLKEDVYPFLRNGTYDREHFNNALATIGKSQEELYESARDVLFEHLYTLEPEYFVGALNTLGFDRSGSRRLWELLQLTTKDIYDVTKFRLILVNITADLNQNTQVAVAVAKDRLALHEDIYRKLADKEVAELARVHLTNGADIQVQINRILGPRIVEVKVNATLPNYAQRTNAVNDTENCIYVTLIGDQITARAIEIDDNYTEITAIKSGVIQFDLGSPVFCDELLYGLASVETNQTIIFDEFYPAGEEVKPPVSHSTPLGPIPISLMLHSLVAALMCWELFRD